MPCGRIGLTLDDRVIAALLAEAHGLRYPAELERIMLERFRALEEG
jgi:hypothetical protein